MSAVSIHCPECAWKMEIDKGDVGATIKCPKCKESFIADDDEMYGVADAPEPKADSWSPPAPRKSKSQPTDSSSEDEEPLSDEKMTDLMSNMEKWAEE